MNALDKIISITEHHQELFNYNTQTHTNTTTFTHTRRKEVINIRAQTKKEEETGEREQF